PTKVTRIEITSARVTTPPPSTAVYAPTLKPVGHSTIPPAAARRVSWSANEVATTVQNGMITNTTEISSAMNLITCTSGLGFSIQTGLLRTGVARRVIISRT